MCKRPVCKATLAHFIRLEKEKSSSKKTTRQATTGKVEAGMKLAIIFKTVSHMCWLAQPVILPNKIGVCTCLCSARGSRVEEREEGRVPYTSDIDRYDTRCARSDA